VLKRYAETLRDRIQALPDVAKTQIIGAQDEAIYVTYDSARLAMSGISAQAIADALDTTNAVAASGIVEAGANGADAGDGRLRIGGGDCRNADRRQWQERSARRRQGRTQAGRSCHLQDAFWREGCGGCGHQPAVGRASRASARI
jgi:multidrug efflux pump subunit AcrB